jgi:hypothetical protein
MHRCAGPPAEGSDRLSVEDDLHLSQDQEPFVPGAPYGKDRHSETVGSVAIMMPGIADDAATPYLPIGTALASVGDVVA